MHQRSPLLATTTSTDHFEYLAVPNSAKTAIPLSRSKPSANASFSPHKPYNPHQVTPTQRSKPKTPSALSLIAPQLQPQYIHSSGENPLKSFRYNTSSPSLKTTKMFEAPSLELHSRIYSGHSNALAALLRKQQMSSSRLHTSGKHSSSLSLNHPAALQPAVAGISTGKSKSGEIAVESQGPQLTEENLKQHSKLTRNQPMSFVERISIWRRSLPDHFEDEQILRDSIQRSSSPKNAGTKWKTSAAPNSRDSHPSPTVGDVKRSLASATAWVPGGNNNNTASSSKRKHDRKALRPLPSLGSLGAEQGKGKQSNTQLAAKGTEASAANVPEGGKPSAAGATGSGRGKLLCCLKVEIKTGVFRMLPVHENDDAHELSLEFCKTNHLMNSVEALKNHVTLSMKTFNKS